jgi:hypothetical protein
MPQRDEILAGKYRLIERIGEGGMGTVWRARNEVLECDVAIKVLNKTLVDDATAGARFRQEARAAAQIRHPNICAALDLGEQDGAPFLVMEHLRGESVAARMTREGTLAPRAAVAILLEALAGLAAAHAAGIIHRDFKPENVFLAEEGDRVVAKILDFGVSKYIGGDAERVKLTRTGALIGTPAYMSPEQALGLDDVDARSDVWAAGVVLYELVAGSLPYLAANYNAMLVKIATEAPRPLLDAAPAVDPALAGTVFAALAHRREDRTQTARALADALHAWLEGRASAPVVPRISMPTPRVGTTPMGWAETAPTIGAATNLVTYSNGVVPDARPRWLAPALVALAFGVGGVVVVRAMRSVPSAATTTTERSREFGATEPPPASPPASAYEVQVTGLPPGSRVTLNGVAAVLPARVPAGERARVEVVAPGREPWGQTITPAGNVVLSYEARVATPMPTPTPASVADAAVAPVAREPGSARRRPPRRQGPGHDPSSGGLAREPDL